MLASILFVILTNRILISCVFCSLLSFSLCSLVILSKCLVCYSCNHRHNILLILSLVNSFYQFYLQNFQHMLLFTPHHSQSLLPKALPHFQCSPLLRSSFFAHEMALPTYIHAGRFPCRKESETSPPKSRKAGHVLCKLLCFPTSVLPLYLICFF